MQVNTAATEVALKEASNEVSMFVVNAEKEVKALEDRFADVVPIATTKDGYKHCKEVRKELMPIKKSLEDARKTLKAPILEAGRLVDSTMNPLAERVGNLITPFVNAYQAVDKEIERKKQARLDKINNGFKALDDALLSAVGASSTVINAVIDELADFDLDPDLFMERTEEAAAKHGEVMQKLGDMLVSAINQEEFEAKQRELQKREAEIAQGEEKERARIEAEKQRELETQQAKERQAAEEKAQAELAKAREEARAKAEIEAAERHKREMAEAEERAKAAAQKAADDERKRIEQERISAEREAAEREANRQHKASVHNAILVAIEPSGISQDQAKEVIKLIACGKVPHVKINY